VLVRLAEASDEVRSSVGWGTGVEKAIKVENLMAPPTTRARIVVAPDAIKVTVRSSHGDGTRAFVVEAPVYLAVV